MREIIVGAEVSMDGVVNNPEMFPEIFKYHTDDVQGYLDKLLYSAEALLAGRLTYEGFAKVWPTRTGEMADYINKMPKHVASRTLKEPLSWNATLIKGDVITNLVNYALAGKGADAWRWMFGLGMAPSGLFLIGLIWLPESPRWLIMAGKRQKAEAILQKIGNGEYAKRTVNEISGSFAKAVVQHSYAALFSRNMRPVVLVGIALAVLQQFCGINVVFNYTSTIFASLGATVNEQLFQTVAIGVVNLIFTVVAMWQVDRMGRRPLMLFGFAGLAIWYVVLAFVLMNHVSSSWVSLVVLAAIATYSVSLAPVTWVLIAEIFPNKIRSRASSVAIVSLWGAYFLLVFTFPVLAEKLGTYGPFWMYAGICLLGLLLIKTRIKESKGKTLEELEDLLVSH